MGGSSKSKTRRPSWTTARGFANSPTKPKSDVIREKVVPVSVYAHDVKGTASEHFSIAVPPSTTQEGDTGGDGDVVPLSRKVYDSMSTTLQKMSVQGKVIIITG